MCINLDDLDIEIINKRYNAQGIHFISDGKEYYYKSHFSRLFNELIAEKIANKMGIPCCHYELASYNDSLGVVSEYFDTKNYISMDEYLRSFYGDIYLDDKNNLEDINIAFSYDFGEEKAKKLMQDVTSIFMFDALIGNHDRHNLNYGLIKTEDDVKLAPLFDNENMLSERAIYYGDYCLGVESVDNPNGYYGDNENLLYKFLDIAPSEQRKRFYTYVDIISEEGINEILEELEKENVIIPLPIKKRICSDFAVNYNMIQEYINNKNQSNRKTK